jgi:glycosyltransferase involved in cell wall biosynthesis
MALPGVLVRPVPRPFGWRFLGRWPLARMGERAGNSTILRGGRAVVNGGNCRCPDVNWVHYVHAAYQPDLPVSRLRLLKARFERPLELRAERAAVHKARVVVCNSERTRRDVIEKLGVPAARTVTVYLGCDPERFRPAETAEREALRTQLGWPADRPVVLFIGALGDRRKGFDTLFKAWELLSHKPGWDAILAVVGQGAELGAWQQRVNDAGLAASVRFLGFRTDVPDLLRAADALVHPARYEAYGLGVHEALCCGIPAVVSAIAGVAERYPAELEDLLLSDPNSANELAERLRHWRVNMDDFRQRVRPLSDHLREYSWDDMAKRFLSAVGEELP